MSRKVNLTVDQGASFTATLDLLNSVSEELDVAPYSANAQMRKSFAASNTTTFTTNLVNGAITLSLTSNQTALIESGRYVYDVKLTNTSSGYIYRIIEGVITVSPGVTR